VSFESEVKDYFPKSDSTGPAGPIMEPYLESHYQSRYGEWMVIGSWSERGLNLQTDKKTRPEFDRYAPSYAELLDDPLRNRFARDPIHFHRRKRILDGETPEAMRWRRLRGR
jgi:hypothetical protein